MLPCEIFVEEENQIIPIMESVQREEIPMKQKTGKWDHIAHIQLKFHSTLLQLKTGIEQGRIFAIRNAFEDI